MQYKFILALDLANSLQSEISIFLVLQIHADNSFKSIPMSKNKNKLS